MNPYKIKLSEGLIQKIKKAKKNKLTKINILIMYDDLFADEDSPWVEISRKSIIEIVSAVNDERSARITLNRSNMTAILNHVKELKGTGVETFGATSNIDLLDYGKQIGLPEEFDVISIDEKLPKIGIVNSTPREDGGRHWTAVYSDSVRNYVFDPFGIATDTRIMKQLKKRNNGQTIVNTLQEQGIEESSCGQRCLCVLYLLAKADDEKDRFERFNEICTTAMSEKDLRKMWKELELPFNEQ